MAKGNLFWGIVTASDVWKETGWNTIIYLGSHCRNRAELYEAAKVDGASRIQPNLAYYDTRYSDHYYRTAHYVDWTFDQHRL